MPPTLNSPNVDNYTIGKGKVSLKLDGDADWVDCGNAPEFELTPNLEKLAHFSSREGVKKKDKEVVTSKSATLRIVLEEMTARNMGLALLGLPNTTDPANITIDIMSVNSVDAAIRFEGTNEVGPKWNYEFPLCQFNPSKSLQPISDEWAQIELEAEVLSDEAGHFGSANADFSGGAAPVNHIVPQIYGTAQVGQTLTAFPGVWDGGPFFNYQWKAATIDIPGANGSTYIPVVGDIGDTITVEVTAINGGGQTVLTSAATAAVIAA